MSPVNNDPDEGEERVPVSNEGSVASLGSRPCYPWMINESNDSEAHPENTDAKEEPL